jgi:hypothetical protein
MLGLAPRGSSAGGAVRAIEPLRTFCTHGRLGSFGPIAAIEVHARLIFAGKFRARTPVPGETIPTFATIRSIAPVRTILPIRYDGTIPLATILPVATVLTIDTVRSVARTIPIAPVPIATVLTIVPILPLATIRSVKAWPAIVLAASLERLRLR